MKLLNLACGGDRPRSPWVNVDMLHTHFPDPNCPERKQLAAENNYVDADIREELPFPENTFDGVLASHVIEHLTVPDCVRTLNAVRRVLVPGGVLAISVPDVSYFRKVHHEDTKANSGRLFGDQMDAGNPHKSFFDCALFFNEHLWFPSADGLWAIVTHSQMIYHDHAYQPTPAQAAAFKAVKEKLNRPLFSLVCWAVKES